MTLIAIVEPGAHFPLALAVADELMMRGWTVVFLGAEGFFAKRGNASVPDRGVFPLQPKSGPIRGWAIRRNRWLLVGHMLPRLRRWKHYANRPTWSGGIWRRHKRCSGGLRGCCGNPGDSRAEFGGWLKTGYCHGLPRTCLPFRRRWPAGAWWAIRCAPAIAAVHGKPSRAFCQPQRQYLRVLVVGGSLGAQALNEVLPVIAGALPATQRPGDPGPAPRRSTR